MSQLLERLKSHPSVKSDSQIGVVSSFGKGAEVDIKPDTRDLIITANTTDIDLEEEVVVPSGADTSYFEDNGNVFADHKYGIEDGVGWLRGNVKPIYAGEHQKSWRTRISIFDSPLGDTILKIVEQTRQIGASIGFIAEEYGPPTPDEIELYGGGGKTIRSIVRKWKWFELSITLLPCNVACQSMAVTEGKSLDMINEVDRMVSRGLIDRALAAQLGMPIEPKRKVYAVRPKYLVVPNAGVVKSSS